MKRITKQQVESVMCSILANIKFQTVPTETEVVCYLEDKGIDASRENVAKIMNQFKWRGSR